MFYFIYLGDIFLLDRGFAEIKSYLTKQGFIVKMPEFIEKKDNLNQLTTVQANSSRVVSQPHVVFL